MLISRIVYLAAALATLAAPALQRPAQAAPRSTPAGTSAALPAVTGWDYAFNDEELEAAWSWKAPLKAGGPFETRVVFHAAGDDDYAFLQAKGGRGTMALSFWRVRDGKVEKWGEPEAMVALPAGGGELTLQRSPWRVRALWSGRAVSAAYGTLHGAKFGVATRGAVSLGEGRMQATEPPLLSDDFMRSGGPDEPEARGVWQNVVGVWKTSGLLGPKADINRNPNPFVYRAETKNSAGGAAATTAGYWWWSDYSVMASVRPALVDPSKPLRVGLAAYRQENGTAVVGVVDFSTGRASIRIGNKVVATGAAFEAEPDQWHRLFLDPGPGTLRLLVNGVERVRASSEQLAVSRELALAQGKTALVAELGGGNTADFDDVRVAPNDAISDDFRTAAVGRWENARGNWQTQTTRRARVKVSDGPALTLIGGDEREEGLVEASFQMSGEPARTSGQMPATPALGAVFGARNAHNFLMARLRSNGLEIVEYSNGTEKTLALTRATPSKAQQVVTVEWREGIITARGGGASVSAAVAAVPAGRVGAWAVGEANSVALSSFRALGAAPGWGEPPLPAIFEKDRLMGLWASKAGQWKPGGNATWWHSGDFFRDMSLQMPLPALPSNTGLILLLGATPDNPHTGARLELHRSGQTMNLRLFENGRELQKALLPLPEDDDEAPVLRVARRPLDVGRVSLRVAVGGKVLFAQTASSPVSATKIGVRVTGGNSGIGPQTLTIPVAIGEREGTSFIGVNISPVTSDIQRHSGLPDLHGALVAAVIADSPAAKSKLVAGDIIRAVKDKDGQTRRVNAVEEVIEAIKGSKPGDTLRFEVWRKTTLPSFLDWETVTTATSHLLDYTFTSAPVDWQATSGRWQVAERWTCDPQWSFFSGGDSVHPTLWSRFATQGDFTLEAYLATPMDWSRGERSPIDLNVTVDADGHDLASGYSFLFGARKRQVNQIWRGDEKVVEKPFQMPATVGDSHQDWYYVRVERRQTPQGLRYRYSVNGQLIEEYLDPRPLSEVLNTPRHVAFWTYNGALSIARVRLWHSGLANIQTGKSGPRPLVAASSKAIPNGLGEWRARRDGLRPESAILQAVSNERGATSREVTADAAAAGPTVQITNPQSGGDWTVYVTRRPFDAAQRPQLRFDYRVPQGVQINLYALVKGQWREILFVDNAGEAITPGAATPGSLSAPRLDPNVTIGRISDVQADGEWHTATFDLLAALQKLGAGTQIEALAFAAPDREYLLAGLGGNHLGATYWIRDFQAAPASSQTVTARLE